MSRTWLLDALKKKEKKRKKNAEKEFGKKKPRLKVNLGLAVMGL